MNISEQISEESGTVGKSEAPAELQQGTLAATDRNVEISERLDQFLVAKIDLATGLSPGMTEICQGLADDCTLPIEWVTATAATFAAGVASSTVRLNGAEPVLLLVAGAHAATGMHPMMQILRAPVDAFQREAHQDQYNFGGPHNFQRHVQSLQIQVFESFADKGKRSRLLDEAAGLEMVLRPIILVDTFKHEELIRTLPYAMRQSLLAIVRQPDEIRCLSKTDLETAARCMDGHPMTATAAKAPPVFFGNPSLCAIVSGSSALVMWFQEQLHRFPPGLQHASLVLNGAGLASHRPPGGNQLRNRVAEAWLHHLVGIYHRRRDNPEPTHLQLSPEAAALLHRHRIQWADFVDALPVYVRDRLPDLSRLSTRLARGLQLLRPHNEVVISEGTARLAVDLAKKFYPYHSPIRAQKPVSSAEVVDGRAEIILERIRYRGPMTRRQLVRTMNDQRLEIYEPAIKQLKEERLLIEDPPGRLAPGPRLVGERGESGANDLEHNLGPCKQPQERSPGIELQVPAQGGQQ